MEQISAMCDISIDELRALNPQYRTTLIPGDSHECILRMPSDKINAFIDAGDSIYVKQTEKYNIREIAFDDNSGSKKKGRRSRGGRASSGSVTVKKGDTLGAIAKRNHTTVGALQRANGLKGTNIKAGQKLKMP